MSITLRSLGVQAFAGLLAAGCAHAAGTAEGKGAHVNVSGTWDWIVSTNDDDNNKRIEQEEWHLRQAGQVLDGEYMRTVTVVSGDENLFRCNGEKRFQKRMRFRVQGRIAGPRIELRETGVE